MSTAPDPLAGGLAAAAARVLGTADPWEKTATSRAAAAAWFAAREAGETPEIGRAAPPDFPARPERPALLDPRAVPRRRTGTRAGRAALLHAIAHIELNAVDLHWDIVARFSDTRLPTGFFDDWVRAADEESKHFGLLSDRLEAHETPYGALPAHAGMWRSAAATAADLMGRLAVVPMVLEARGLDVTPDMIAMFERAGDAESVAALKVIYAEEVGHVAYGSKWFHFLCGRHDLDPKETFHGLVRRYFDGALRPPFNDEKRAEAGLPLDFYWPLADAR
ncbi:ferritin-like domain-containing protein [Paralimibaculum aggregatum]|uniref:Ferritin-like domain-containing protein n=1 Tax=Paralimibaculum aggregatum TaxID=3036245 RepID=A0ABQ6LMP8_9RHOB|nr:ferritin-like domain-containing protein [Limibaculum sp. NKW23]